MGDLLLSGEKGVEKNPSEAVWWYTMAAYQVFR
jgi:TPR repeat protein